MVCTKKEADEIIIANHYSHKATKNSFLSFLVYYKDKVAGALQVGYGINPRKKGTLNPDEVREFDRMWLSDDMPKYSETITLSLLHHYLRKVHPEIKYLISYADNSSDVGNEGTIYKAANYKLIDKIKSDFYILESGERVHPVTMWHRHGTRKWAFCSILLPEELQKFYSDKFDLTSESGCEQKLSLFGLVNMDEFDRYSVRSMATLKNLMQLKKLTYRKSHRSYYIQLPRIASFIGTSNQKELLTDTTGSRRFLCVEVKGKIDCSRPDYAQLYAQLKAELLDGERFWFTSEEERDIQMNNRMFYKHSPEEDVFFRCFRLPEAGEDCVLLSPTEIYCRLQKKFPAAFRGGNVCRMGRLLTSMGVEKVRSKYGIAYRVVPV